MNLNMSLQEVSLSQDQLQAVIAILDNKKDEVTSRYK
jgi:hypothetical protein